MLSLVCSIKVEVWSVLIAVLAAIWAIWANTLEWKRSRFIKGIELLDTYRCDFSDEPLRNKRRQAARYLLEEKRDHNNPPEALVDILDFFECIAYLKKRKLFEIETVWHFFASWILPYVAAANEEIKRIRSDDSTLFEDLLNLYTDIESIEKKRHPSHKSFHIVSPPEVKSFLKGEIKE